MEPGAGRAPKGKRKDTQKSRTGKRRRGYFYKKIRYIAVILLSTGKCKIIDLSEENILGSVKI